MITIDGIYEKLGVDFIITHNRCVLAASLFHRSEQMVRQAGAAVNLGSANAYTDSNRMSFTGGYTSYFQKIQADKEEFFHLILISKDLGKKYFLTSPEREGRDFYEVLMSNFKLPLLKEWGALLLNYGKSRRVVDPGYGKTDVIYGSFARRDGRKFAGIPLNQVISHDISIYSEAILTDGIKWLFESGTVKLTEKLQQPLPEDLTLDGYFSKYGKTIVEHLAGQIHPVSALQSVPDTVVLKGKRLYPQQATIVQGAVRFLDKKSDFLFINEGMGTGKTLQALSIAEGYANLKALRMHPGMSLKDLYSDMGAVKYRNIVMCPSHLVEKWKAECEAEIPYAKATIISTLEDLVKIKKAGIQRIGKEFFIISKDFAKLGNMERPTPVKMRSHIPFYYKECTECGAQVCAPVKRCMCSSTTFKLGSEEQGHGSGLICPECKQLLYVRNDGDGNPQFLTPKDFAKPTGYNRECPYCGTILWAPFIKNVNQGFYLKKRKHQWKRATHYVNKTQKATKSVWVLDGYENDYFEYVQQKPIDVKADMEGIRKYSPALYIKKHLKNFFDFAIFDECHEYKGGSTAQGHAMHALIKSSKKQLALTGTIAGGKADHLFYLLYRLCPWKMKDYGWNGAMKFSEEYGTVERTFSVDEEDSERGAMYRGRQLSAPKTKPGISPRIFTDFLLDSAVFLDLDDMSKYLPEFKEQVVTVPMERDVSVDYHRVVECLQEHGRKNSAIMSRCLQFALSYSDKPFLEHPAIIHPQTGDELCEVSDNSSLWEGDHLLPKEEKLVELIKDEISEDRNCVVYAEYTASEETNVCERLKTIIERHVKVKAQVLYSNTPAAIDREEWMHKQAREGVQVFITNPRCVATGLDFCWKEGDKSYNFPTLFFYQLGYSLFVVWQASRRAYRLVQREECRVYYMAYENTIQAAVISLIAQKQVATSAIQGKFSTEGISAMAEGVDERVQLAAAMSQNDFKTGNIMQNMFDVLAKSRQDSDCGEDDGEKMLILRELIGTDLYDQFEKILHPSADEVMDMMLEEFFQDDWPDEDDEPDEPKKSDNNVVDPFDFDQKPASEALQHIRNTNASVGKQIDLFSLF